MNPISLAPPAALSPGAVAATPRATEEPPAPGGFARALDRARAEPGAPAEQDRPKPPSEAQARPAEPAAPRRPGAREAGRNALPGEARSAAAAKPGTAEAAAGSAAMNEPRATRDAQATQDLADEGSAPGAATDLLEQLLPGWLPQPQSQPLAEGQALADARSAGAARGAAPGAADLTATELVSLRVKADARTLPLPRNNEAVVATATAIKAEANDAGASAVAMAEAARRDPAADALAQTGPAFAMTLAEVSGKIAEPPPAQSPTNATAGVHAVGSAAALMAPGATADVAQAGAAPPLAEAPLAAAFGSPEFAPALGAQITTWLRDGVQQARLQLNPAEMGPIAVQISLDGSAAQIQFAADHAATRSLLEQSLPELATSLRDAGFTLAGGGVFQQPRDARGGRGEPGDGRGGHAVAETPAAGGVEALAGMAGRVAPRGLLDLFA